MTVIKFEHVSKVYCLESSRTSLREAVAQIPRKLINRNNAAPDERLFWALKDVSFEVEQGEVLGIIGHNGAGKSTILKLLSRVSFPTQGHIQTEGRMAALIELGAGFHPDLSGRENVYLNGSILGLKRREITAQLSKIIEFAGLEKFIDTPVKRYSSGMYVRLAFAVAAHVRADILLVDEVLSVGDMAFQQKCLKKMNELRESGTTIVFVSHNLWSVSAFCKRTILLQEGQIRAEGKSDQVIDIYRRHEREKLLAQDNGAGTASVLSSMSNHGEALISVVELLNQDRKPERVFSPDSHLLIRVHYVVPEPLEASNFVIRIHRADGLVCCMFSNRAKDLSNQPTIYGKGILEANIGPLQLVPDLYTVEVIIAGIKEPINYAHYGGETFQVTGRLPDPNFAGVFTPKVEWSLK